VDTKRHVLVVDDEPGIGTILRFKLQLHGYDVTSITSGAEAIDIIRKKEPDIVLLDILMPDVTGMDVLDAVRAFSKVPILVMTAKPSILEFAMKLGANGSIAKPFDPDAAVKKIEAVLASTQK
jgi:DNA-binding response OmpR family regulator